ncbi:MAG: diaminopimelate epimerase [Phycisphaerae bacterium]|nr:diaminopimelate epimerase [Saprospiraceae bacterium]
MKFWKYQGTGNDFIMLDQRDNQLISRSDTKRIEQLCNRRFGIGADGLILLQSLAGYDFEMVYFNADGRESSMCGNGGRCIVAFAWYLGIIDQQCRFMAIDGVHEAKISGVSYPPNTNVFSERAQLGPELWVNLKMSDVQHVEKEGDAYILNTGSPHYVRFVKNLNSLDMVAEGRAVRYSERWKKDGINVNLVAATGKNNSYPIRTYERGVEDETYACGTGATAAAIATFLSEGGEIGAFAIGLQTKGGHLTVQCHANGDGTFSDIWLSGPAVRVFEGHLTLDIGSWTLDE